MQTFQKLHWGKLLRFSHGKAIQARETGLYPVYGSNGVIGRADSWKHQDAIVLGRVGAYCGSVKREVGRFWASDNTIVVKACDGHDLDFVYYLLVAYPLNELAGGSAQPLINQTILSRITTPIPDLQTQKKIASILSAYDDLIENNKRRIAILEKMAEEIYREWFVRMRFPASAKATAGKPGSKVRGLPSGWKVSELREVATVNATSLGKKNLPEMINYIDISAVGTNRIDSVTAISASQAPGRARRVVQHGDIIWSSVRPANRAYCLILNPVPNLVVSTGFAVIRSKGSVPFSYLYFAVTTDAFVEQMSLVAKGSAYPATSFEDFERAKLIIPSEALLFQFDEICLPIFLEKENLLRQNQVLGSCRDLLLPRLISGKLSVEHLELPSNVSASTISSALPHAELAHA